VGRLSFVAGRERHDLVEFSLRYGDTTYDAIAGETVTRREKLLEAIRNKKAFAVKWRELVALMRSYGFELQTEKGGSHFFFVKRATGEIQHAARPHPGDEVHPRVVKDCLEAIERSERSLKNARGEGQHDD
jgi:predicted RNA binding protein YcfA (HicA-like mRNA interferase family)